MSVGMKFAYVPGSVCSGHGCYSDVQVCGTDFGRNAIPYLSPNTPQHTHTHTHTHTHSLPSCCLSLSHAHAHTHTHTFSLSHTHTHTHSLSLSHTHTRTLSLSHTHTHTHTQVCVLALVNDINFLICMLFLCQNFSHFILLYLLGKQPYLRCRTVHLLVSV
jgi:hypothetical protein